jgi:hypothetical protein
VAVLVAAIAAMAGPVEIGLYSRAGIDNSACGVTLCVDHGWMLCFDSLVHVYFSGLGLRSAGLLCVHSAF